MDNRQFDDLARLLATGMSRRRVLQVLLGGAGAGLLALIGLDWGKNSYATAGPSAAPTSAYHVFVPLVQKACSVASTCANKVFCSADQVCRCIKSAEGPILCGKVPDCNILHCKTSADCASLGPGYFCDTPNSGCCSDGELQRCIAPCIPPGCPPERTCGSNCCPEGQVCVGTTCCPTAQACGTTCCPTGNNCVNGKCVVTCASDPVTSASLDTALAALAGGANQVALSPNGCLQYKRAFYNGTLNYEEIKVTGGAYVSWWNHYSDESYGYQDADLDGFAERKIVITRGATVNDDKIVITHYMPAAQNTISSRTTVTRTDDIIHVQEEHADANGVLQVVDQYDQNVWVSTVGPASSPAHDDGPANRPSAVCSQADCDPAEIRRKFQAAVDHGLLCLNMKGANDLYTDLTEALLRGTITFKCLSIPDTPSGAVLASTHAAWPTDAIPKPEMDINQDAFCDLGANDQLAVLFHESIHLIFLAYHNPWKEKLSPDRRRDVDRFYACQRLCFYPPSQNTQCTCATCLGTTKCDQRCATSLGFQTCSDDFGAWCPCPTRIRWYPSCTECLTNCPSGLGCFFIHFCLPDNDRRCAPTTCP